MIIKLDSLNDKSCQSDLLAIFNKLNYENKVRCYYTIKNKSCIQLRQQFKENINQYFFNMLESLKKQYNIDISFKHISPLIYEIECMIIFQYLDYTLHENEIIRIRIGKGGLLPIKYKNVIEKSLKKLTQAKLDGNNILKRLNNIASFPYVKSILPYSHWATGKYRLSDLNFHIEFEDFVHNKYIKEFIGKSVTSGACITENYIIEEYKKFKKQAMEVLNQEYITNALKNNSKYQEVIWYLKEKCITEKNLHLSVHISYDYRELSLLNGHTHIFTWQFDGKITGFEDNIKEIFVTFIDNQKQQYRKIKKYIDNINNCSNKVWKITNFDGDLITLYLCEPETRKQIKFKLISLCNSSNIENDILVEMHNLLDYAENCLGIRFLEVR